MQLQPKYHRVLLKLSGEALAGEHGGRILDDGFLRAVSAEIASCARAGVQFGIVIGAGNIWRGARQGGLSVDRVRGDHMGMLATVINSLAMQDYLLQAGLDARVMSAFQIQQVCEPYAQYRAREYLEQGSAVLIPCGVGYPYFSTDTGMMLRAVELNCDILLSAKHIDGVYDDDPAKNPNAKKYDRLTYDEMLAKGLQAIDLTASAIGRENRMPALVFGLSDPKNITRALAGEPIGTLITA